MTDFIFNPQKNYPFILTNGNEGTVLISGISIPDDPESFFMPLLAWINDYLSNQANSLTINFELFFYTPTSSKYFFKLFQTLKTFHQNNKSITVNWHYSSDDDDIKEEGEEFKRLFEFPFNIIEKNEPASFNLNKTEQTPLVYYDQTGDVLIEGNAIGPKPWEYFYPIIKWLERVRFDKVTNNISFEINISSINSLNLLYVEHIMYLINLTASKEKKRVQVNWGYNDSTIMDFGYSFKSKYNINFVIIERE